MQDGLKLQGLVNRPKGEGSFPLVIFLHGSGGMRDDHRYLIEHFANNNVAGALYARRSFPFGGGYGKEEIRYRDYIFKDISDLNTVVERLKGLSFVRDAPIFVAGISEGGQIAYLASSQIKGLKGVVGTGGVTDYLDWYEWTVKEYVKYPDPRLAFAARSVRKIFGCTPEECRDRYTSLSPIHHIEQISCPIMIVHGGKDLWVPVREAHQFAKTLQEAGKPHETHIYPSEGHLFYFFSAPRLGTGEISSWLTPQVWSTRNSRDVLAKMLNFIDKHK
jgi:dipeptidyl aminopeptidase/acylaminoacyl peptidase